MFIATGDEDETNHQAQEQQSDIGELGQLRKGH
jgi:hypothetical protein